MLKRSLPQNRPRHHYYDLIEKQWLAVDSYISRLELTKFGWESEPYVTHLLDGFSRLTPIHHIIPLPVIFSPKVSPSPNLLSFFLPPLFSLHQSDKLPPQINFFPHFYITQSSLWVETPYQNVPSIQPFPTLPQNIKVVLNSNIDRFGKHFQILPLTISCTLVRLF